MTKNEIKQVKQLQQKKYRQQQGLFVVEGWKSIQDYLQTGMKPEKIFAVETATVLSGANDQVSFISQKVLQQISGLKHPKDALAIFKQPVYKHLPQSGLILVLDNLQDPGNLGTIIRTADWFGIQNIVCSMGTVDCYNPKVVQASMGSLAHVQVYYTDLTAYLPKLDLPVYGTFLKGNNLYREQLPEAAAIVIGNEGQGISSEIAALVTHKITIPKALGSRAESLNASVATAIIVNEFKRKLFLK